MHRFARISPRQLLCRARKRYPYRILTEPSGVSFRYFNKNTLFNFTERFNLVTVGFKMHGLLDCESRLSAVLCTRCVATAHCDHPTKRVFRYRRTRWGFAEAVTLKSTLWEEASFVEALVDTFSHVYP